MLGRTPDPETVELAEKLGVSLGDLGRIGKHEARRLMTMDESSRRLVIAIPCSDSTLKPLGRPEKRVY